LRRYIKPLLKLIVSLILVGIIVWKLGGLGDVVGLIGGITPWYVVLILLVNTADRALMTYKWGRLLRSRGVHLPFLRGLRIYCASMVWGMFLPATLGADAIRAFSTSRTGLNSNEVVASIIIERMVGFLSALLLGLLGLVLLSLTGSLDSRFVFVWWLGSAVLIGATLAFAASFSRGAFDFLHDRLLHRFGNFWIMQRLRQFHLTYRAYQDDKGNLATFFGLTLGEQLMPILHAWLIARGMGVEVGLLYVAGAIPLALLISRIPVSVDGLGVFDGAFILLMSLAGVSPSEAIAISLVGRIIQTASWLPWWMAYVIDNGSLRPPRVLVEES
jgi:uncharacterized protein (TIRG00374 family)